MTSPVTAPRIGARVLLLDEHDRVLLMHARDPDNPSNHWWELPGGGLDHGETLEQAAIREVTEETGIELDHVGPQIWIRESRFRYRNRDHHRIDHIFLARRPGITATVATTPTENEKLGLLGRVWFSIAQLHACPDKLLPASLPTLLEAIAAGDVPSKPIVLHD
jgi:8-oxo-dGTP pyrophosphatase MutT (NUDIX family)